MGYVKNYLVSEPSDYKEEYFYMCEDEYLDAVSTENDCLDDEYNIVELTRAIGILQECAKETGLSCEKATAALNKFIEEYEDALALM